MFYKLGGLMLQNGASDLDLHYLLLIQQFIKTQTGSEIDLFKI